MKMHTFYDKKGKISFKHLLHCITEGRKVWATLTDTVKKIHIPSELTSSDASVQYIN
jgi:hypothetical protein